MRTPAQKQSQATYEAESRASGKNVAITVNLKTHADRQMLKDLMRIYGTESKSALARMGLQVLHQQGLARQARPTARKSRR